MQQTFTRIQTELEAKNFTIIDQDFERPWGGFFVIDPTQSDLFIQTYFPKQHWHAVQGKLNLSPKLLMVAPDKRLSWQYHLRRSELWSVQEGPVGVVQSNDDTQGETVHYNKGEVITLKQGERHRLLGLNTVGIVAEIWQHTDINHPSNEEDIIRLQDDFGRENK